MFAGLRKRNAIRSYRGRLGRQLIRMYGGHRMFTIGEVRSAVERIGLSTEYVAYAYALYCTQEVFDAHHRAIGVRQDYKALRRQMLVPPRYPIGGDGVDGSYGVDLSHWGFD